MQNNINIELNPFTNVPCDYFDWQTKSQTFWNKKNPLCGIDDELNDLIDGEIAEHGEIITPVYKAQALLNVMYFDLYNNGGGNASRWSITKPWKKKLTEAGFSPEVKRHLAARLSKVFTYMCRGRNFGWVQDGCDTSIKIAMEALITDMVYFSAKKLNLESLKRLEAHTEAKAA